MRARPYASLVRRTTIAALMVASLSGSRLAYGQCPTSIPQSVLNSLATPEIRSKAAAVRIDQAFLANGGARAILEQERRVLAQIDSQILSTRDCRDDASSVPNRTTVGNDMGGACVALLEKWEETRRAQEAAVHILQCWAGQSVGGTSAPKAPPRSLQQEIKASCGEPEQAPFVRDDDPRARTLRAAYETRREAYMKCTERVMDARYATGIPGFGPFGGAGLAGTTSSSPLGDNLALLGSAIGSLLGARANVPPPDLSGIAPGDARRQAATTASRPLLENAAGAASASVDARQVDDILNPPIAFEYEMPRTSDPRKDFLKRISGELRSNGGRHEISIRVGDIDRNWLTTDRCATLDVTFQATIDVQGADGAISKAFPTFTIAVDATDGTADVRSPVTFGDQGRPVEVKIVATAARPCGVSPQTTKPASCPASLDDVQKLIDAKKDLSYRVGTLSLFHNEKTRATQTIQAAIVRYKLAVAQGEKEQAWNVFLAAVTVALAPIEVPAITAGIAVYGFSEAVSNILFEANDTVDLTYQGFQGLPDAYGVESVIDRMNGMVKERRLVRKQIEGVGDLMAAYELFASVFDLNGMREMLDDLNARLENARVALAMTGPKLEKVKSDLQRLEELCPTSSR